MKMGLFVISGTLFGSLNMVPGEGPKSNCNSNLFAQWEVNSKDITEALDGVLTPEDCEEVFDTLAEWNEYLEQHVPYFREPQI
ncbi:hypothetical protein [Candidatus Thiodiazotropha sp. CDECU1]|uniref:hypothetical protein n=1 Tax=Candidatus Thiodiazotropha sp. CDECU1 TaxID=3065865 RepID=UPI002931D3AC|nr:hypothetical protein [Candidatus Thiodiazotropha sp. CDECU1]